VETAIAGAWKGGLKQPAHNLSVAAHMVVMTISDAYGNLHDAAGLFARKHNSAPGSNLSDDEDQLREQPSLEDIEAAAHFRGRVRDAHATIMRETTAVARSYRLSEDTGEDVAQDAWIDLLTRSRDLSELIGEKGLLKLIGRTLVTRQSVGYQHGMRHEDFQARRRLQEQEDLFREEHGRSMTPDELKAAANAIRMAQMPGRRAKEDFYVQKSTASIDAPVGVSADGSVITIGDTLIAPEHDEWDEQEDAAASALHEFESGTVAHKARVKAEVWRVVSIRTGAPNAIAQSVTSSEASSHRKRAKHADGGVAGMARRWMEGLSTPAEDVALFAPFGDLDIRNQQLVAEVLDGHSAHADVLWLAALKKSERV
jgi:hypothetical protein